MFVRSLRDNISMLALQKLAGIDFGATSTFTASNNIDVFIIEITTNGYGTITTEIIEAPEFYYAEDYHQQYLAKVPHGYCGLGGTGLSCPSGTGVAA